MIEVPAGRERLMTQKGPASDSLGKLAARSMGWVVADKWGTRFTSLLILVVLGRLLSPADFGLVALASMFITFAGIFVEQGFGKALVQRQELQPEHIDAAFWTALGVAAVVTLATVLVAGPIAQAANLPALAPVLRWLALGLVFNALSSTPSALLERSFGFKSLAIRRLCSTFAGGVAAIGVALAGGGVWSLVAQTLVGAVAGLVALWAATQWRPRAQFRMSALRQLWPVGFGVLGIEILSFIGSQSDRLIVGAFLGTRALGLYFMAMRIVAIMVEVFASIFSAVSLTMFSRLQQDEVRLREWLYRLTAASSALTLPCFALAAALAPVAVPFVIGAQWSASVTIFQILTLLGAVNSVAYFDRSVLLARGRARAAFLLTLGQSILGIVLVLVAAP
jgi:PST family polysaccharide transporter